MHDQARRTELAQFLRTRRERLAPEPLGLPSGTRRRTPGLRREELALLAGVGTTWYTWLEQGRAITVSRQVLESLARVLQLNPDERTHLFILAREHLPADPFPLTQTIDPVLQLIVDTIGIYPALVLNPRWDILAWNQAACRVLGDFSTMTTRARHILWFFFTDQHYRSMLVDWEGEAQRLLALFRASTERFIGEAWFTELVQELQQVSPAFREWWPRHEVKGVQSEHKHLNHPGVGRLVLQATTFQVADHPEVQMVVYTPVDGTDTAAKLAALGDVCSPE